MNSKEAILICLNTIKEGLIADQLAKGMRATGRSAESLRVVANFDEGTLYGSNYFQFQVTGRGPGGMPPIEDIARWIEAKRLDLNPWAVAKSIAKNGTAIHRGERKGLSIEEVAKNARVDLAMNLLKGTKEEVLLKVRTSLKK